VGGEGPEDDKKFLFPARKTRFLALLPAEKRGRSTQVCQSQTSFLVRNGRAGVQRARLGRQLAVIERHVSSKVGLTDPRVVISASSGGSWPHLARARELSSPACEGPKDKLLMKHSNSRFHGLFEPGPGDGGDGGDVE